MRISDWSSDVCSSDLVITDHHLPGDTLPDALAIVNPNQPGCGFPSKNLAGVGVIFYMMLALRAELRRRGVYPADGGPRLDALSDLVALGTVADVVKLDANNRSEERSVGKECVSTCRSRWSTYH